MKKKKLLSALLFFGSGLLGSPGFAQTQIVTLTTSKAIGETVTLVVNPDASVYVDWGDGQTVRATSDSITGTLASQTITLTGGSFWETLVCEDMGLTELDLTLATNLKNINCQGNELTSLNLRACGGLENFNCANNALTSLSFTSRNASLKYLNCAGNALTSLSISSLANLETLICDGNELNTLNASSSPNLKVLWCSDNNIGSLYLVNNRNLQSLMCSNNAITSLTLASQVPDMNELWCDNNSLSSLNTSNTTLKVLNCNDNALSSVEYPSDASSANKMYSVFCGNNNLTFANFIPQSYVADHFVYTPQGDFTLPVETIDVDSVLDLSDYNSSAYLNRIVTFTWYQNDGTELKRGSKASGADYNVSLGRTTFYTPQTDGVYCVMTSSRYPELAINTTGLTVVDPSDPTAIQSTLSGKGLSYQYDGSALNISADEDTNVTIVSLGGIVVWNGNVGRGGVSVPLTKGIYLINGKHIVL